MSEDTVVATVTALPGGGGGGVRLVLEGVLSATTEPQLERALLDAILATGSRRVQLAGPALTVRPGGGVGVLERTFDLLASTGGWLEVAADGGGLHHALADTHLAGLLVVPDPG